jgi:acyl carrier protein
MILPRLIELIEESTQSIPGSLEDTSDLRQIEAWDSMSAVMFIALVEEETGVTLSGDELRVALTPQDLFATVTRRASR